MSSLKRFNDLSKLIDKYHPQEPHYYLHAIGVKNAFRRKGAGSSLLAHVLDIADNEQMPAYLENSNELNLSLYQKYGFKVIGKESLANEGPPIWFMYRSPQTLIH
ncbi:MAG: GNAT family N-acetyltransferase [Cyanobacteria bacterium P01_F01_bin.143]